MHQDSTIARAPKQSGASLTGESPALEGEVSLPDSESCNSGGGRLFAYIQGLPEEARQTFLGRYAHVYRKFIDLLLKLHEQDPKAGYLNPEGAVSALSRPVGRIRHPPVPGRPLPLQLSAQLGGAVVSQRNYPKPPAPLTRNLVAFADSIFGPESDQAPQSRPQQPPKAIPPPPRPLCSCWPAAGWTST